MILRRGSGVSPVSVAAIAIGLTLAQPVAAFAHEIPARVVVRAFVRPEGQRLRLLVRVPLEAIRDVQFAEHAGGYLDVARADSVLHEAARLWIAGYVELFEDGTRLGSGRIVAARISPPSDRSFGSYADALARVSAPSLPAETNLLWRQALLDVLLEYPISSPWSRFSIRPAWAHFGVRTTTVLRFLPAAGEERALEYVGDPGLVRLDPRWHQSALRFVSLGFQHILDGLDHLLFVFCLVIPFRRLRPLVLIVTSFTVAHSITLVASAMGLAPDALWFPPLIETLIALSIVYMAIENIVGPRLERRWLIAFAFGLVHGFGFSFALRESLQFAGSHLLTSLLSFNVGVELGQLFVLVLVVPALALLFRHAVTERTGTIILSALVAHSAWHWMTGRYAVLRAYRFEWPALDLPNLASAMRGTMLLLVAIAAAWLVHEAFRHPIPGVARAAQALRTGVERLRAAGRSASRQEMP